MTENSIHPQRLYLIQLGSGSVPLPNGQTMEMSLGCYLVQMSDGRNVLIDTGLPIERAPTPGAPSLPHTDNVVERLADLGLRPDDISIVISTHFDQDHAGSHDSFPNADHVVQRTHYEQARSGHPRFASIRAHWDHPSLHYRLVDGDTELLPGLTLLETSGHTTGHQSVLVRLPQTGPVLLIIDAVPIQRLFTPDRQASPLDENEEQLRASTRKLIDIAEREHATLVVFGHDGAQWQTLKKAPAYYE